MEMDKKNKVTGKIYQFQEVEQTPLSAYSFASSEAGSLGGTLLTALPYVNPRFLYINRNNADSGDPTIKYRSYKDRQELDQCR